MFKPRPIWLVLAVLALAGCNLAKRDPSADAEARRVFDELRQRRITAIQPELDPSLGGPNLLPSLARVAAQLPEREPVRRTQVRTSTIVMTHLGETVDMVDEYDFGDRRAVVATQLHRASAQAPWLIQGLHVQTATLGQLAANRFRLVDKPLKSDLFLAYAFASPLLMLAALTKVVRTPGLRRKWLWAVLAFGGVMLVRLDWTTGQFQLVPLTIQLIGFGIMREASSFSPWIVSATVPLGAVLILTGVWANPKRAKPAKSPNDPAPPAQLSGEAG